MISGKRILTGLTLGLTLWAGGAPAQNGPDCDGQGRVNTPEKVTGQVTWVDMKRRTVTLRAADGATHEFYASKDTLQDVKVGDRIEATLRQPPRCQ